MRPEAVRVLATEVAHDPTSFRTLSFADAAAQLSPISDVGNVTSTGPLETVTVMAEPDFALAPAAGDCEITSSFGTLDEFTDLPSTNVKFPPLKRLDTSR